MPSLGAAQRKARPLTSSPADDGQDSGGSGGTASSYRGGTRTGGLKAPSPPSSSTHSEEMDLAAHWQETAIGLLRSNLKQLEIQVARNSQRLEELSLKAGHVTLKDIEGLVKSQIEFELHGERAALRRSTASTTTAITEERGHMEARLRDLERALREDRSCHEMELAALAGEVATLRLSSEGGQRRVLVDATLDDYQARAQPPQVQAQPPQWQAIQQRLTDLEERAEALELGRPGGTNREVEPGLVEGAAIETRWLVQPLVEGKMAPMEERLAALEAAAKDGKSMVAAGVTSDADPEGRCETRFSVEELHSLEERIESMLMEKLAQTQDARVKRLEEDEERLKQELHEYISPAEEKEGGDDILLTPQILDGGDHYEVQESVWDTMFFVGIACLGTETISALIFFTWFLNLFFQLCFVYIVQTLMMEDPFISEDKVSGLLSFRLNQAHRVENADRVAQRSLASLICEGREDIPQAGRQFDKFEDIARFTDGAPFSVVLAVLVQITWLCTIMKDIYSTMAIARSISHVRRTKQTQLVVSDLVVDNSGGGREGLASRSMTVWRGLSDGVTRSPRSPSQIMKALERGVGAVAGGGGDPDIKNALTAIKMVGISTWRCYFIYFTVCLPKLLIAVLLYHAGSLWLGSTVNFTELILNAVALEFVLNFDEIFFETLVPRRAQNLIRELEPLPSRPIKGGSCVRMMIANLLPISVVAVLVLFSFVMYVHPIWMLLVQGERVLCSGNLDFVFSVNPATTMIHTAAMDTYESEEVTTLTELILAQKSELKLPSSADYPLAHFSERWFNVDGWEPDDAIQSAIESGISQAVNESTRIVELMNGWSLAEAGEHLPCADLAVGTREGTLETLRQLMDDRSLQGCQDIDQTLCSMFEYTWLRALCPVHCRCDVGIGNYVGFFGGVDNGCPSQCQLFKSTSNEISFRYALTKTGSSSSRSPRSAATSVTDCQDLPDSAFSFSGGCSDRYGPLVLDYMSEGCSYYDANPRDCGRYDHSNFNSSYGCCSCGGGRTGLPSSLACWDDFTEDCWSLPDGSLSWLLFVKGLFEMKMSEPGVKQELENVVNRGTIGLTTNGTATNEQLIQHILSGGMGQSLVSGNWELLPNVLHPRGLTGCSMMASYEMSALLGTTLCSDGNDDGAHSSLNEFCPVTCKCEPSSSLVECPASCVLGDECSLSTSDCGFTHPWYSTDCAPGKWHDGEPSTFGCITCDGVTRRRRASDCTPCTHGYLKEEDSDDCRLDPNWVSSTLTDTTTIASTSVTTGSTTVSTTTRSSITTTGTTRSVTATPLSVTATSVSATSTSVTSSTTATSLSVTATSLSFTSASGTSTTTVSVTMTSSTSISTTNHTTTETSSTIASSTSSSLTSQSLTITSLSTTSSTASTTSAHTTSETTTHTTGSSTTKHTTTASSSISATSLTITSTSRSSITVTSTATLPCVDLPGASGNVWTDGTNDCGVYASQSSNENDGWCASYGATDYNGEGAAQDVCCVCGGGEVDTR